MDIVAYQVVAFLRVIVALCNKMTRMGVCNVKCFAGVFIIETIIRSVLSCHHSITLSPRLG